MTNFKDLLEDNWVRLLNESLDCKLKNKKVLDVGCGSAQFSRYLVKGNNEYYGLDLQIAMRHPSSILIRGDAQNLPFQENQFDVVLARELLHHTQNPGEAIKEMRRVGKCILIIEANRYAPYMIWAYYEGHKHFSSEEFKNILRKSTKNEPTIYYVGIYAYRLPSIKESIQKIIKSILRFLNYLIKKKLRISITLQLIFCPTHLLESLLFYASKYSPHLFFSSRLFANHYFGIEMIYKEELR